MCKIILGTFWENLRIFRSQLQQLHIFLHVPRICLAAFRNRFTISSCYLDCRRSFCLLGNMINTKVFPNLITYLLIKFQNFRISVARSIVKLLSLCFLQNCNSREVEMEFLYHLNLRISTCAVYQSCSTSNYLAVVKISKNFVEQNEGYEFSRNSWRYTNCLPNICWVWFRYASCAMHLGRHIIQIADAWTLIFQMIGATHSTLDDFDASGSGS